MACHKDGFAFYVYSFKSVFYSAVCYMFYVSLLPLHPSKPHYMWVVDASAASSSEGHYNDKLLL
jgi:uncharacterized membrane protein